MNGITPQRHHCVRPPVHWPTFLNTSIRVCIIPSAHTPDTVAVSRFHIVHHAHDETHVPRERRLACERGRRPVVAWLDIGKGTVSYTHLTLPTSDLV